MRALSHCECWISAHLFYTGDPHPLLKDCLWPLIQESLHQGWIDRFFFIRYAEHGPHIRLRLQLSSEEARPDQLQLLTERCETFFRDHPSDEPFPLSSSGTTMYLPNTIQYIAYHPEIKRYGTHQTIHLAERQFQASSQAVLHLLTQYESWNESRALSAAILLHIYLTAPCMSSLQAICFFQAFSEEWLPEVHKTEYREAFENSYQQMRRTLIPYIQNVWQQVADESFDEVWQQDHIQSMREIDASYHLHIPSIAQRMEIYQSFVHMTHNRLGVPNHEEAWIAYLISHALQDIHYAQPLPTTT